MAQFRKKLVGVVEEVDSLPRNKEFHSAALEEELQEGKDNWDMHNSVSSRTDIDYLGDYYRYYLDVVVVYLDPFLFALETNERQQERKEQKN